MSRTAESYQASEDLRNGVSALEAELAELRRLLVDSTRREAGLQENYQVLLDDAIVQRAIIAGLRLRVKTLGDALGKYGRHDLTCPCSYFSVGHVCECGLGQALAAKEPKAESVDCECGVTIVGEFTTDGDGNPICSICLSEAEKEPKS